MGESFVIQHNEKLLLTIDNGTQSVRALIFDLKGKLLAKSKVEFEPYFSNQPGWAEQNVENFWHNLSLCCQRLWQQDIVIKNQYQNK